MAAARRVRHVAASQAGFISIKSNPDCDVSSSGRRKRVNKNKKKNWNKHSDVQDVEEFLDDVRLQERATGGLIADKPDDSLFYVDAGEKKHDTKPELKRKTKNQKPLWTDLILRPDSHIPAPKDILAHQRPNAKKLRRVAQKAEQLAALGVLSRPQKRLQRRKAAPTEKQERPQTNNDPAKEFYDLWTANVPDTADSYYLEQTKRKLVKRPEKLNEKPSVLPAIEVIGPGGSYNPDFMSHQALLLEAHDVEVKKLKVEEKLERKLAFDKEQIATQESIFKEQVEGLVEEEDEPVNQDTQITEDADVPAGSIAQREKKTERQRKKEKAERIKELNRRAAREAMKSRQQLFKLRSIQADLRTREQRTKTRQMQRKTNQEAQKALPRRLGKLKFHAPDLEVQLSDELAGSLRTLKPEGSILKDRFKSLQKRNLIEPRERAKFKRKYKVKYVEKRAFREIQ